MTNLDPNGKAPGATNTEGFHTDTTHADFPTQDDWSKDPEEASAAATSSGHDNGWATPREIKSELPLPPAFDAQALLPKPMSDFVLDEADRMPCPPDYVAAALLVVLGAVIGAKCGLKPKRRDDWIVTPNLYGGVVGDPSEKKTPAVNIAIRFLDC